MGLINQAKEKNLEGNFIKSRKTLFGWVRNGSFVKSSKSDKVVIKPKSIMILISHFIDSNNFHDLITVYYNNTVIDIYLDSKEGAAHAIDFHPDI